MRFRHPSPAVGMILVGALAAATPAAAPAGFMLPFSGNSQMSDTATAQGVVSFAVFNTGSNTANWLSSLDAALKVNLTANYLAGAGSQAHYVYLYEVVNLGPANLTTLRTTGGTPDAVGYFTNNTGNGVVFQEAGSKSVAGTANPGLGPDPSQDDVVNGKPSSNGASGFTIAQPAGTVALKPVSGSLNTAGFATVNWLDDPIAGTSSLTANGGTSTIIFMISDARPMYGAGSVGGAGFADGDVPVTSPAPSSLALLAAGLAALGGLAGWRRFRPLRPAIP